MLLTPQAVSPRAVRVFTMMALPGKTSWLVRGAFRSVDTNTSWHDAFILASKERLT